MVSACRKKYAIYIVLTAALLMLIVFLAGSDSDGLYAGSIKNTDDLSAFLSTLGWEYDLTQCSAQNTVLPTQFDETFISYNAIQIQQGCDLSHYAGKQVTVYTVPITNYADFSDTVLATVIVYKGRVIGGDIHAAAMDGFMLPLK